MDEVNVTSLYNLEPYSLGHQDEPLGSLVFFTIVYVLVLISGLVGNFIVLYVILKNKDLKHFTNYFFANLSAADVFVLIFCVPTAIHDIWAKDQWYMGKFFCYSNQYIESCVTSISSLTITAISFERFIAICEPFKVRDIFNETSTLVSIVLIWTIGLILSLPFLIFADFDSSFNPTDSLNNSSNLITVCQVNANSSAARAYITWFIIVLIFIPFFVLIFIYARIVLELARHRKRRLGTLSTRDQNSVHEDEVNGTSATNNDQQQSHSFLAYQRFEQKRLNTMIICMVTVAFFACQFPVRVIQLIDMYGRVRNEAIMPQLAWIWLWKLSKLLFFVNFTANPIIYNLLSTKFRHSCQRLLQIHRSFNGSKRKGSMTSYLYSSIYKSRRRKSSQRPNQQSYGQSPSHPSYPVQCLGLKSSLKRPMDESNPTMATNNRTGQELISLVPNRNQETVSFGKHEEIPIGILNNNNNRSVQRFQQSFQVLNEEDDEDMVQ